MLKYLLVYKGIQNLKNITNFRIFSHYKTEKYSRSTLQRIRLEDLHPHFKDKYIFRIGELHTVVCALRVILYLYNCNNNKNKVDLFKRKSLLDMYVYDLIKTHSISYGVKLILESIVKGLNHVKHFENNKQNHYQAQIILKQLIIMHTLIT